MRYLIIFLFVLGCAPKSTDTSADTKKLSWIESVYGPATSPAILENTKDLYPIEVLTSDVSLTNLNNNAFLEQTQVKADPSSFFRLKRERAIQKESLGTPKIHIDDVKPLDESTIPVSSWTFEDEVKWISEVRQDVTNSQYKIKVSAKVKGNRFVKNVQSIKDVKMSLVLYYPQHGDEQVVATVGDIKNKTLFVSDEKEELGETDAVLVEVDKDVTLNYPELPVVMLRVDDFNYVFNSEQPLKELSYPYQEQLESTRRAAATLIVNAPDSFAVYYVTQVDFLLNYLKSIDYKLNMGDDNRINQFLGWNNDSKGAWYFTDDWREVASGSFIQGKTYVLSYHYFDSLDSFSNRGELVFELGYEGKDKADLVGEIRLANEFASNIDNLNYIGVIYNPQIFTTTVHSGSRDPVKVLGKVLSLGLLNQGSTRPRYTVSEWKSHPISNLKDKNYCIEIDEGKGEIKFVPAGNVVYFYSKNLKQIGIRKDCDPNLKIVVRLKNNRF